MAGITAQRTDSIGVTPLAGVIGAEVEVDLANIDDATFAELHAAFLKYLVLVIPGQRLSSGQQAAFARRFGDLYTYPHAPGIAENKDVLPINMPDGLRMGRWHSDATFDEVPPAISILAAQQLPSRGGETAFANQYAAFETLSDGMKGMICGLEAVHDASSHGRPNEYAVHPVVRTHPETGLQALFVNHEFTRRFTHMTQLESAGLLDYLTTHAHQPEFCYVHRWREGDVVIWDNRAAQHYPVMNRPEGEVRRMWRVTVAGMRPEYRSD